MITDRRGEWTVVSRHTACPVCQVSGQLRLEGGKLRCDHCGLGTVPAAKADPEEES